MPVYQVIRDKSSWLVRTLKSSKDMDLTPTPKHWKKLDERKSSVTASRIRPSHARPTDSDKPRRNIRKNVPWWNSPNESSNPRILNQYRPWWVENNFAIEDNKLWTVHELREEAKRRGLPFHGKKAELIERINQSFLRYRLTDDNFSSPSYETELAQKRTACYPEVYENVTSA